LFQVEHAFRLSASRCAPQKVFGGVMNLNTMTKQQTNNGKLELTCLQTNTSTESVVDLGAMRREQMPVLGALARANSGPVPGKPGYSYRLDIRKGFATYEIRERRRKIVSGVVAWNPAAEAEAWKMAQDATKEIGMIPVVVADTTMRAEEVSMPLKPDALPWLASSLHAGVLNGGTGRSPLFLLAFRTDEGLATTGPLVAATKSPLLELANFEMLLSCAILAQVQNGQLGGE
jgi:hypothetical protein